MQPVLVTIPISHYCEKARWGLDRAALPYCEEPHAPLLHRLATKRNERGTVPVLVHEGQRLCDSTAILKHADAACGGNLLYPRDVELRREVEALEERFDTELGPNTRRWAYEQVLPQTKLIRSLWMRDVPPLEARVIPMITPIVRRLVRMGYKITPESARRSLDRVRGVFRQVDEPINDGRRFLVGDCFTAADLTLAALAAPVLLPPECRAVQPALEDLPANLREEILRFRETSAGRFALRMFSQERRSPPAQSHRRETPCPSFA